jgi:hypothetical protein
MKNLVITKTKKGIEVEIDLSADAAPSSSGKTLVIASTGGNYRVPDSELFLGVNCYRYENPRPTSPVSDFNGVKATVAKGKLRVLVTPSELGPSASGKTVIMASTNGNKPVTDSGVFLGLNCFKYASPKA